MSNDVEALEVSDLEKKIIRQVEYYFGDANLLKDKFLIEEIKKDDGWVTLATLLTFNRLKSLSEDAAVILTALRKSANDIIEINKEGTAIRRNPANPLPGDSEEHKLSVKKRSCYAKGFPLDSKLDDLIEFFDKHGGASVQMRRDFQKKNFKGSVFVLFKTEELANTFLEAEEIKYGDNVLTPRLTKENYFIMKESTKLDSKQASVQKKDEMKRKKEDEEKQELQQKITKGAVLKVSGLTSDIRMEDVKEFFGGFGKVAWVDLPNKECESLLVRFGTENEAQKAWDAAVAAAADGKVSFQNKEIQGCLLEGEEEEAHWAKIFKSINDKFKADRFGNRGRGGKFRGRGGRRGGGRGRDDDEPNNKKVRLDDSE